MFNSPFTRLYRSDGVVTDIVYHRAAQLLKIDDSLLKGLGRTEGVVNVAEPMQVRT